MKVGVIGSGGREHSICLGLKNSSKIEKIFCFPGNAGTSEIAENVILNLDDFEMGLIDYGLEKLEKESFVILIYTDFLDFNIMQKKLDELGISSTEKLLILSPETRSKKKMKENVNFEFGAAIQDTIRLLYCQIIL